MCLWSFLTFVYFNTVPSARVIVYPLKLIVPLFVRLVIVQFPVRFQEQPLSTVITALSLTAVAGGITHNAQEISVSILIHQFCAGKSKNAMGIGDIEHIAVFRRQAAAGHGKLGGSDIRIAAH